MTPLTRRKFGALAASAIASPAIGQNLKPILIGLCNDQSSLLADAGGIGCVEATRMAISDFGGKVLGRPVEVIYADHLNKAENAVSIVKRWIDVDKISLALENSPSGPGLAIQALTKEKNIVAIHSGSGTSDLTGIGCSPVGFHWTYDTFALAATTGAAVTKNGGSTWFFISVDYNFGQALERDTTRFVVQNGGKVLGNVRHPQNTADFASYLLQAQASGAKIIGIANAGADTNNTIAQAAEFGIGTGDQRLVGMLVYINTIHALGLEKAQGLLISASYYWDLDEPSRAFGRRFMQKMGRMPSMAQAGTYSGALHWLKGVERAGTDEAQAVSKAMREIPIDDFMSRKATIRKDGRVIRDMHLFQVKKPSESKYPWDYYKHIHTMSGEEVSRPLAEGGCSLAT